MKTSRILLCYLVLILVMSSWSLLPAETAGEIVFYVSPNGNDSQSGTSVNKAFATLQKAKDAIRTIKQNGKLTAPVTVYLLGGTYELSETFILTIEDSGTETCPITYRAYKSEKPIISGGRAIKSQWEQYKGNIMVCNIPEAKDGKWKFRQFFLNGKRMDRARIPDKDQYYRIEKTDQDIGRSAMKYREGDFKKWNNLDEVEVVIFHSWNESRLFISDIDEQERIVTFTGPIGYQLESSNRYYIENVLEGLDQPGEWYLDSHSGKLYLYPNDDLEKSELRAPVINQLVRLEGNPKEQEFIQYINFKGLTFTDTDYDLPEEGYPTCGDAGDIYKPSAITFEGTKFCTFENNCIRNVGTYALEVTGDGNKITSNEIYDTGGGGIITRSYGKERNIISYNHIHDCGTIFYSSCGVNVDDGGGEIAHNLIHDISQTGVYGRHWGTSYQANQRMNQEQGLIIEFNEIHDVMQKINDGAGIFIRDSNIIIRNNLIYNVYSYTNQEKLSIDYNRGGTPGWGIYLGCETRNSKVENNVIYGVTEGMHLLQGTRYNTIENNIFVDCDFRAIRYEALGMDLIDNRFIKNIVYLTSPYAEVYNIDGVIALPLESDYNVLFHTGGKTPLVKNVAGGEVNSFEAWLKHGYEKNSIIADPLFKDRENHDYTLLPESPALKLGFKQIDLSNVGLRGSEKHQ